MYPHYAMPEGRGKLEEKRPTMTLLTSVCWHHAVNDQESLDAALSSRPKFDDDIQVGEKNILRPMGQHRRRFTRIHSSTSAASSLTQAIEADIIFSASQGCAVMGHPPASDGDLSLASFLEQVSRSSFQIQSSEHACPILKLDFKSDTALDAGLAPVTSYLRSLPPSRRKHLWINADILKGPPLTSSGDPRFAARDFLDKSAELPNTTLSPGWTTGQSDVHSPYVASMVDDMMTLVDDLHCEITFPVRATSFNSESWLHLRKLLDRCSRWTLTLWWSKELPREQLDFIYNTLESDERYKNRTYYDIVGLREYLCERLK